MKAVQAAAVETFNGTCLTLLRKRADPSSSTIRSVDDLYILSKVEKGLPDAVAERIPEVAEDLRAGLVLGHRKVGEYFVVLSIGPGGNGCRVLIVGSGKAASEENSLIDAVVDSDHWLLSPPAISATRPLTRNLYFEARESSLPGRLQIESGFREPTSIRAIFRTMN